MVTLVSGFTNYDIKTPRLIVYSDSFLSIWMGRIDEYVELEEPWTTMVY